MEFLLIFGVYSFSLSGVKLENYSVMWLDRVSQKLCTCLVVVLN